LGLIKKDETYFQIVNEEGDKRDWCKALGSDSSGGRWIAYAVGYTKAISSVEWALSHW
jgi:hypothetical protein